MARIQNFWDLKTITSYSSHSVDQFDTNTVGLGGGNFKWIVRNNASITDIPGIRIKPSGTTDGYWVREFGGELEVEWFGTQHTTATLLSQGITQIIADARYGTAFVDVTTDTYDMAAISYAMKLLETTNYGALNFTPRKHYVNRAVELPVSNTANTGTNVSFFTFKGNGATILTTNSNTFNIFNRVPSTQSAALSTYVEARFNISGFVFVGSAAQGSGQAAIRLGPSYGSLLNNIEGQIDIVLNLEFCLNARLENIQGNPKSYGIKVDYGSAWGGNNSNSQSNNVTMYNCRFYTSSGAFATYYVRGCSGVEINACIAEGFAPSYAIYFNNDLSTVVKNFRVKNFHLEVACSVSAIYLRANGGEFVLDGISDIYGQTFIEFDVPTGYPQLNIHNMHWSHSATQFANKNSGGLWKFVNCELGEAPWQTSPSNRHPYKASAWITTGAYFQPKGKYSAAHALQTSYRCYVIDPVLRQLTSD